MNESRLKTAVKETNFLLLIICLAASAMGILVVMSATMWQNKDGELFSRDAFVMLLAVAAGIIGCLFISFLDYEVLTRKWFIIAIFVFCVGIMLSLRVIGVSPDEREDATRWWKFGEFYFQPSALVMLGVVMSFATHLNAVGEEINKPKQLVLLILHGGIIGALVVVTGDMGSALVFFIVFGGMLYMAGLKWYYFAAAFLLICAALPLAWIRVLGVFHKERLMAVYPNFLAALGQTMPEETHKAVIFQQQRCVEAISSGGLMGQGLFNGDYTQQQKIPVSESDMIFAVIGEEFGFVGAALTFILLAAIVVCCVLAGRKSRDNIGKLICGGIALMIGIQAIVNIGMCLKFLPCIGITLPFFSAGGSSNLCVWLGIGIVMSISRHSQEHGPTRVRFIKRM